MPLAFTKVCGPLCGLYLTLRCRRYVRPAASPSARASAFARPAGRNCRSSNHLTARGLAFPLSTIRARAFCRWRRSPTRRPTTARAAVRYDEIARTLVQGFKYSDRLDLAPMMGRWTARAGRELLADADALVPMPLHWRRQWTRRFNQSAALAGAISAICNVPVAYGSSASGPRRSRSGGQKPSAPTMCKAPSGCRPSTRPTLLDGAWF